ncbi:hypothetical protein AALD74_24705 [Lachnospiraceae bacterium 48-21]|jgi:hypothetical protein
MKKKWVTLLILSIFIGILIYFQAKNEVKMLNPTPRFAPITQFSMNKFESNDDNESQIEGYSSTIESFSNGYIQDVSIVSHRIFIPDKEEFAKEVIQMIIDNSLKGIMFSYDVNGYPNELHITVYLNEAACRSGNSSFKISYTQDIQNGFMYNIKDDPEKFVLEIIEE